MPLPPRISECRAAADLPSALVKPCCRIATRSDLNSNEPSALVRIWLAVTSAVSRLPLLDALLTLLGIYALQYLLFTLFISAQVPAQFWRRPFEWLPAFVYVNWDGNLYRQFFESYDRYFWPPLYIFTLRGLAFVCQFSGDAFAKSALIVNLVSHYALIFALLCFLRADPRARGIAPWLVTCLIFSYPGHNVFFASYSESYYLALTLIAFLLHQRGRLGWASFVAGASGLVRTMGTFLVVAFVVEQLFYAVRDRKLNWRSIAATTPGLVIIGLWNVVLWKIGTTTAQANADWKQELINIHIRSEEDPRLWVLRYLSYGPHWEVIAFWAGIAAAIYCLVRKRYAEMFYVCLFYASMAVYVYRPFPFSRFISVLFPIYIMAGDFLKTKPRLATLFIAAMFACSLYVQIRLFSEYVGEP